jgi:hypothetical protein
MFQPKCVNIAAVRIGESQPPRFPDMFISPESEPEKLGVMSLQVAHHMVVANRLKPEAPAPHPDPGNQPV